MLLSAALQNATTSAFAANLISGSGDPRDCRQATTDRRHSMDLVKREPRIAHATIGRDPRPRPKPNKRRSMMNPLCTS
jgi:hypothetical protein